MRGSSPAEAAACATLGAAGHSFVGNLQHAAAAFPDRCAIQDGESRTDYAELLRYASWVAGALHAQGLRRGERVALILNNSTEFVAAYYGVLLAGGVAVLLNPAAKSRDFAAWLSNCAAAFVLSEPDNTGVDAAIATLEPAPRHWRASGDAAVPFGLTASAAAGLLVMNEPAADDAACMLYTSGTTAQPKGVVLSHRNLASNTAAIVEYLGLTCDDSSVTILPFYYSYGSSVLHTHLKVGARLVLEKNLVYPHAVVASLARERATGFAGVPSTFALLLSRVKLGEYDLSSLRYVTQAGGALSPALAQRLSETLPHAAVIVMYGQTEATARLTYLPAHRLAAKPGSVGVAIPGVKIEVRTESGASAEPGETGEVWAQGPNVMLGYWNNDAATAQVKQEGWLKTGDMGYLDADGFLYLAGRRSDMIKAGAHRIHPQDIEDVIAELPQVQEVAVVGVEDATLGQSIRAFVVPVQSAALSALQIQGHCRERLANYKVPKSVEIVASLPRTASGKIRRSELIERSKQ